MEVHTTHSAASMALLSAQIIDRSLALGMSLMWEICRVCLFPNTHAL